MIQRTFLIMLVGFFLVVGGCTTSGSNVDTQVSQVIQDGQELRVYQVFGMDCPACHAGLEKLIEKLPTVQQAKANWEKKQLTVTVKPGQKLNDEDVYDAIRRANFTVGERIK